MARAFCRFAADDPEVVRDAVFWAACRTSETVEPSCSRKTGRNYPEGRWRKTGIRYQRAVDIRTGLQRLKREIGAEWRARRQGFRVRTAWRVMGPIALGKATVVGRRCRSLLNCGAGDFGFGPPPPLETNLSAPFTHGGESAEALEAEINEKMDPFAESGRDGKQKQTVSPQAHRARQSFAALQPNGNLQEGELLLALGLDEEASLSRRKCWKA